MRFDLTVNEFTKSMFVDRKLVVYGEQFWRPYVHVYDAARAIQTVLTAPAGKVAGKVFKVGDTSEKYKKADLVEIIGARVGPVSVDYVSKAEDPRDYKVAFERIRKDLGYRITKRVPDGVEEIIRTLESGKYSQQNPATYNVVPASVTSFRKDSL